MLHYIDIPVTNHNVGISAQDGRNEGADVSRGILAVCIKVDNYVRSEVQRSIQADGKSASQAQVSFEGHQVVCAASASYVSCLVRTTVVNNQYLNLINSLDTPRDLCQRSR
jgi:hypothetical protein